MTLATAAIPTPTVPHSTAPGEVRVWDRFVRLFHWSLVVLVAVAAVTGFLAPPWWIGLHLGAGTAIAALVFARVVWGFVGSGHARFADFVVGPRAVLAHLTGRHERAPATLGHNPLGGWMILALIAALTALTATGMTALGGELKSGPLAFATSFRLGTTAGEIHAVLAIGLLGLVAAHVGGALF